LADTAAPAQATAAKEAAAPKARTNSRFGVDKRTRNNRATKEAIKTKVVRARQAIAKGDTEAAKAGVAASVSALDKAAQKKVLHKNTAARRKSRLVKRLNKAAAAPAPKAKK
jgi:small subunit ribosomal protein S20